jgi:chromosome segregation ATPase
MTDSPEGGFNMYAQLLLESIDKLSGQTEELKKQYAALDKTISLLKQSYEANLLADHQAFHDLIAKVQRITEIVEELSCFEYSEKIKNFQERISILEQNITPSKWAAQIIADFFQKTGWIYGALLMGSIGYGIYYVAVKILPH